MKRTIGVWVGGRSLRVQLAGAVVVLVSRRVIRPTRALTAAIRAASSGADAPVAADTALAECMVELGEARAELQRALVRFTQLQEDERRKIAQALHDQTIQTLIATLWALQDLQDGRAGGDVPVDVPVSTAVLTRVRANLETAVAAARSMLVELRPPALDDLGVVAAVEQELQRLAEETGISVRLDGRVGARLPAHVETLAFRTAQEALRNVRQHASASAVQVSLHRRNGVLDVEVEDDGIGVDPAVLQGDERPHAGVVAMRENIVMAGGSFAIGLRTGRGTIVRFSLPAGPPATTTT